MTLVSADTAERDVATREVPPLAEISRLARLATVGTIPEAIRRLRRAATSIGASGFCLFFAGRDFPAARLMHCFDESFPAKSSTSAEIASMGAEILLRHAGNSSLPLAWGMALDHAFVVRSADVLPDRMGLALPVHADPVHSGILVFTGADLRISGSELEDLHRICFEVFAAVAQMKLNSIATASSITKRELECLMLTAAGRTSEDIARILGPSIHTANQYLTSASAKLDAVNRTQATAKAIRLGLIE